MVLHISANYRQLQLRYRKIHQISVERLQQQYNSQIYTYHYPQQQQLARNSDKINYFLSRENDFLYHNENKEYLT